MVMKSVFKKIPELILINFISMMLFISCCFPSVEIQDAYITFLPDDREWEMQVLQAISDWDVTAEDPPEWQFSELLLGYDADDLLGYYIYPQYDADDSNSADITYLKELGQNFRLDFTFKQLEADCLGPHVELISTDGLVRMMVTTVEDADPSRIRVVLKLLKRDFETEPFVVITTNSIAANPFNPTLWYTLYIDMRNGNHATIDIDERDGNEDTFDNDIVEFSTTLFFDSTSKSFRNPVFRSPCEALDWIGVDDGTNYWIGDIHYRNCSDGVWPNPHELD